MTTNIMTGFYSKDVEVTIDQQGQGRPVLLLHGGGGPPSMGTLPSALSEDFEVIAPVHPGFAGTPRPEWYDGIDDVALTYLQMLEQRDLRDVLVVGSSVGGWIASEMAVREHDRISGTALLNAVGISVDGIELADFFSLTPQQLIAYSFHDPSAAPDPTQLPQEARDIQAANAATLTVYARDPYMHDPKLRRRLPIVPTPVVSIWGESDQIAPEPTGAHTPPHSRTVDSSRSRKPDISLTSSNPSRSSKRSVASATRRPSRVQCPRPTSIALTISIRTAITR